MGIIFRRNKRKQFSVSKAGQKEKVEMKVYQEKQKKLEIPQQKVERIKKESKPYERTALILSIDIPCGNCKNGTAEILTENIEIGYLSIGYPESDLMELVFKPRTDVYCEKCKTVLFERTKKYKVTLKWKNMRVNEVLKVEEF